MKALVIGASGATGKLVVNMLLEAGCQVNIIVRANATLPQHWLNNTQVFIIRTNISDISPTEMVHYLSDCDSIISCLGHTLSWRGVYGKPRQLVTNAVKVLVEASTLLNKKQPLKLILMNTAGYRNKQAAESVSFGERLVIALLRLVLPPHLDNENAADFLAVNVKPNSASLEWVIIRPNNLIDNPVVTDYKLFRSPIRSAIFKAGKTSRINVAHFMTRLSQEKDLWNKWKGNMPVIYNHEQD